MLVHFNLSSQLFYCSSAILSRGHNIVTQLLKIISLHMNLRTNEKIQGYSTDLTSEPHQHSGWQYRKARVLSYRHNSATVYEGISWPTCKQQHCVTSFEILQRCDWRFRSSEIWRCATQCNRISAFRRNAIPSSSSVSKFPLNEHCRWSTFLQNVVIRLTHDAASHTRRRESSILCSVLSIIHNYGTSPTVSFF